MSSYSSATPEHQRMVDSLAKYLGGEKGLQLLGVAHDNYSQKTWEIGGKVPDVIARDNSRELLVLGECKTADDIDNDHTREQLTAWGQRVMSEGRSQGVNVLMYLSVQKASIAEAEAAIRRWELASKVIVLSYGST